jgi:hypothetical protein
MSKEELCGDMGLFIFFKEVFSWLSGSESLPGTGMTKV